MRIEFDMPAGESHEWLVNHLKQKLVELYRQDRHISRAGVQFSKNPRDLDNEYSCAIDLTIFGSSISVRSSGESYERSVRDVLDELSKQVDKQVRGLREPPDEMVSSVRV